MEWKLAVLEFVKCRVKNDADRSRIGCTIGQPTTAAIDRARVHARAATDTLQRMPEIRHPKPRRSSIVNQHNVQLSAFSRPTEMRGVLREWGPFRAPSEKAQENAHVLYSWDQLLDTDARDVKRRHSRPDIGITFVGADHESARLSDRKVAARHTGTRSQKSRTGIVPHDLG